MVRPKDLKRKEKKEIKKIEETIILDDIIETDGSNDDEANADSEHASNDLAKDAIDVSDRIKLGSILDLEDFDEEPEASEEITPPTKISIEYLNALIEFSEELAKKGDKESNRQALKRIREVLDSKPEEKSIIDRIDSVFRNILSQPDGQNDALVWNEYAEFCKSHDNFKKAIRIFQKISEALWSRLNNLHNSSSRRRYVLSISIDVKNNVVTSDFKGEGHYTKTYELKSWGDKDLVNLMRDTGRIAIPQEKNHWLDNLKDVGVAAYDLLIKNQEWSHMFIECNRKKGIIEFKIDPRHVEFPIELLYYGDFVASSCPIRKQLLNIGDSIDRSPLSAEYYAGESLNALLVASNVGGLTEVDNEIRKIAESLLEPQNMFNFNKVVCLSNDRNIENIDPRIKRLEPTIKNFIKELERGDLNGEDKYDLLHFSGHSVFDADDTDNKSGLLFMDNEIVNILQLKESLQKSKLRFIYLNSCESGRQIQNTSSGTLLSNIRASLIAGVPAVLAMRWPIYDTSAKLIAESFYSAFGETGYPEVALHKAKQVGRRKLTQLDKNDISWAAPMLIMH